MTSIAENISDTKIRFLNFTEPFKEYRLGDITETISRPIKMEDEKDYLLVTVKRRNEGIVERGIYKGKEVKVKSQFKVDTGDFLISKRQIIHGACEIVPSNMAGAIVSNEYHILHGKKELLLTEYLNLLSKTPKLKNYFALACVGVDIEKMLFRIDDWKKRVVKIPSIEEQQKIVDFFNLFNRKLVKQQEKIEKLEQFKKGMMQKIFSQELRFKDEDGGEFPEWKDKLLNEISAINPKTEPIQDQFYYIDLESVDKGRVRDLKIVNAEEAPSRAQRVLMNSDVLFQTVRPYQQNHFYVEELFDKQLVASTGFAQIRTDQSSQYIYYLMHTEEFAQEVLNRCTGTSYPAINSNDLGTISVAVPSLTEQKKIVKFLFVLDKKINKEKDKLMVLEEQKKGLMQGMFI